MTLDEKIRVRLNEHESCVDSDCHHEHMDAVRAALDLRSPVAESLGYSDVEYSVFAAGWHTCRSRMVTAIARELGVK